MDRMTRGEAIDAPARVRPVVVLATCLAVLESADEDAYGQAGVESGDDLLAEALRDRDVETYLAAWDDPTIEWDVIAACVLRSTWDYPESLTELPGPSMLMLPLGGQEVRTRGEASGASPPAPGSG